MRAWFGTALLASALVLISGNARSAPSLPPGFSVETVLPPGSFDIPTDITFAADGRIFVAEKKGVVWVVENGAKLSPPFLDLSGEVMDHYDRGLLGIALHPDFPTNGYLYLAYTWDRNGTGDFERKDVTGRLTRYQASSGNPNVADPTSRTVLIGGTYAQSIPACYFSHAPGTIQFGSDGTLLLSAGDGASYSDVDDGGLYPECFAPGLAAIQDIGAFRSQFLGSMAGKILRIDPLTGEGLSSNPYYTGNPDDIQSKVWAYGLRNPFRFGVRDNGSQDPTAGNPGSLYIGDVGWSTWEEINVTRAGGGENFAWPCWEGPNTVNEYLNADPDHSDCSTIGGPQNPSPAVPPTVYWHHDSASSSFPPGFSGNSAIGGTFYRGTRFPQEYRGAYFYGDFAEGWIKVLYTDSNDDFISQADFATSIGEIVDIEYDPSSQHLYFIDIDADTFSRIRHQDGDTNAAPVPAAQASPLSGTTPLAVQFTGSGSFDPDGDPITYAWDFGDGTTSDLADPSHVYTTAGVFTAELTVTDEFLLSSSATLEILAGSEPPEAIILSPANGQRLQIGTMVSLSALVSDDVDPPGSLQHRWDARYFHNDHGHPPFFVSAQPEASFVVGEHGLPNEVNFVEVMLRVTDSDGLVDTTAHYLDLIKPNERELTSLGTPIALIGTPSGSGNPDLEVIRDGVRPPAGSTDPLLQYDTFTGDASRFEDWIGYSFAQEHFFTKMIFQEGLHGPAGGFFESFRVEVRRHGSWSPALLFHVIPQYRGNDGAGFDAWILLFYGTWGDAIRVIGVPGGTTPYISVSELQVFEVPDAEFSADLTMGPAPLSVQFTDGSNVGNPTAWQWQFGDGTSSTEQNPVHLYSVPGSRTVSLSVAGDEGTFIDERANFILVGSPGLAGEYYDNEDFTNLVFTRIDPTVDFDWGSGSPGQGMGTSRFSVRWTGWLQPLYDEEYTLYARSDDGMRVSIDGQWILDAWSGTGFREVSATLPLQSQMSHAIQIEYKEVTGSAEVHLDWSSPSQPREVVPTGRLLATECVRGVGDVDASGALSQSDAFCALNIFVHGGTLAGGCNSPLSECELKSADANCDDVVTPIDALAIYEWQQSAQPMQECLGSSGARPLAKAPKTVTLPASLPVPLAQTILVPLNLGNASGDAVRAFGLEVTFPIDVLEFHRVETSQTLTEGWVNVQAAEASPGQVLVGGFDPTGLSEEGVLAYLVFEVRDTAVGTGPVTVGGFVDDLTQTTGSTVVLDPGPAPGAPGLLGTYYANTLFSQEVLERVDASIDFDWGNSPPHPSLNPDDHAVAWTGEIHPEFTEDYTLYTYASDAVGMWIDGELILDEWYDQPPTEHGVTVPMTAGQPVTIRLEHYQDGGYHTAQLLWESNRQPKEVIPSGNLTAAACGQGDGDVDGSGALTTSDAQCTFESFLQGGSLSPGCDDAQYRCELAAADVNCDGRITPHDAREILLRQQLGLPPAPCLGTPPAAPSTEIGLIQRIVDDSGQPALQVSLVITDPTSVAAYGLQLDYPTSELVFQRVERTYHSSSWFTLDAGEFSPGQVRVGAFDGTGFGGSQPVEAFHAIFAFTGSPTTAATITVGDLTDHLAGAAIVSVVTGTEPQVLPGQLSVGQNHPNPFNPQTLIPFVVPETASATAPVRLSIFNVKGERVRTLVDAALGSGPHSITWDGKDDAGGSAPSGVYFYTVESAGQKQTRRMVLLR